ncbi:MAG TPA: alpha/beta hydrolase, partial [Thermoanaerobaculia bacterium]|nr:alpha/beta hydrolase [Thermoanaerobaculia bacterium]
MTAVGLNFIEEGDGQPVVLLHGFPEDSRSWKQQLPVLAKAGYRAIAPDLRGYHLSPKPKDVDAYRITEIANDVAGLIEKIGAPVYLVAHDWGAFTAWFVAMMRPELLRKLVILNVPHPVGIRRELQRSLQQKLRASYQLYFRLPVLPELTMKLLGGMMLRKMAHFTRDEIATYKRAWRGSLTPMLNYYRAQARFRGPEVAKLMKPITLPTMIIYGDREPVFIRASFGGIEEWVPNLRFETIPGIGHFVQHDAPERVNELLLDFL